MKKWYFSVLLSPILLAIPLDRVAVTIGNYVITESEVEEEVRVTDFLNNQPVDLSQTARRQAAERLIDQHLVKADMQVSEWPQPEASEAAKLEAQVIRQKFGGNRGAFEAALKRDGISENQLKQHLLWQLAALRYTEFRFQPGVTEASPALRQQLEAATQRRSAENAQQAHPRGTQPPLRLGQTPPPRTDQTGAPPQPSGAANPQNPVPRTVEQQMDAWLKQARSRARIVYHQEAFQ